MNFMVYKLVRLTLNPPELRCKSIREYHLRGGHVTQNTKNETQMNQIWEGLLRERDQSVVRPLQTEAQKLNARDLGCTEISPEIQTTRDEQKNGRLQIELVDEYIYSQQ